MYYQRDLFSTEPVEEKRRNTPNSRVFAGIDRYSLTVFGQNLCDYLKQQNSILPFSITSVLDDVDWVIFEEQYKKEGRAPFSPKDMFGLILYGYATGNHSLRELEKLAVFNIEAAWACSGIKPDFTTIAKFIDRFKDLIGSLFVSTTKLILKKTNSDSSIVSVDGTTIRAAASNNNLKGSDSLDKLIKEAEGVCERTNNESDIKVLEQLQKSKQELEIRQKKAKNNGKDINRVKINIAENDAMYQKNKQGNPSSASYKVLITTNKKRIITSLSVVQSNETDGAIEALAQNKETTGKNPEKMLADAGFNNNRMRECTSDAGIKLISAEGRNGNPKASQIYTIEEFNYDEENDRFTCPNGIILNSVSKKGNKKKFTTYSTPKGACFGCSHKENCSKSKTNTRTLTISKNRDLQIAVRENLEADRELYKKRAPMVETSFAWMRGVHRFNRFTMKGLGKVRPQFTILAIACNMKRLVSRQNASKLLFLLYIFYSLLKSLKI